MNKPTTWWPAKAKYVPFWDHVLLTTRCALVIPNDHAPSIPHEVGHYFHHLLLDSGYGVFARNPRPNTHAAGTPGAKNNLIEEPAYFAEYCLKGSVSSGNPEGGTFAASGPSGPNDPTKVDFTDLEGFGTEVLALLIRDDDTMSNYKSRRVPVPVVEGDRDTLFQSCFEIIAQGTNDIPTLIDRVKAVLTGSGQQAKLPVMLQALGLTYRVRMRIVDGAGRAVANVTARPICKVDQREYVLPPSTVTDDNGQCTFGEFFPGSNAIRIYEGTDSTDVGASLSTPWSEPTTQIIDLGSVTYAPDQLLEALHRKTEVTLGISGMMTFENGDDEYTVEEHFYGNNVDGDMPPISWAESSFSYNNSGSRVDLCEGTINWSLTMSGTVDIEDKTIDAWLDYEAKNASESYVDSWSVQITGLPLSASSVPPYAICRFSASGPGAASYVGAVQGRISHLCATYQPGNYTGMDWGNSTVTARVSVIFYEP